MRAGERRFVFCFKGKFILGNKSFQAQNWGFVLKQIGDLFPGGVEEGSTILAIWPSDRSIQVMIGSLLRNHIIAQMFYYCKGDAIVHRGGGYTSHTPYICDTASCPPEIRSKGEGCGWNIADQAKHGREGSGGVRERTPPEIDVLRSEGDEAVDYLAGRTSICIKLPWALMLWMRICVPVLGLITLPCGLAGS